MKVNLNQIEIELRTLTRKLFYQVPVVHELVKSDQLLATVEVGNDNHPDCWVVFNRSGYLIRMTRSNYINVGWERHFGFLTPILRVYVK